MGNVRTIYLDWNTGVVKADGGAYLARQYDHLSNLVIFENAPQLENYYLLVEMKNTEDDFQAVEQDPIMLAGAYWLIPNSYTQLIQPISFQVCCKTETDDFEQHSAKFTLNVIESMGHTVRKGVDPSIMFDPYKDYVDQEVSKLIVAAGDVEIDSSLSKSGAAAEAKAVGDKLSLLTNHNSLESVTYSASATPINVVADEDNNLVVTMPNRIYVTYFTANGVFAFDTIDSPGDYTVPHGSFLVADSSSKSLSVKTFNEVRSLPKASKFSVLCFNYRGVVLGPLSRFSSGGDVTIDASLTKSGTAADAKVVGDRLSLMTNYTTLINVSYSASAKPIEIVTDDSNNLIVTMPDRIYVTRMSWLGVFSYDAIDSPGEYTVPNGSYLISDSASKTLMIKTFSEVRSMSKTSRFDILCFNDRGTVLGPIASYFKGRLPYYDAYIANLSNTINTKKASFGLNGISFFFITDEHWKQNAKKSTYLIDKLHRNTGIDLIVNGGDILTKEASKSDAFHVISNFVDEMEDTGCSVLSCIGNHEFNNPNMSQTAEDLAIMLSLEEVCSVLYNRTIYRDAVFDKTSGCYYFDVRDTRIFVLQCNYGSNVYLTATRWVMEQLTQIPEGYKVIVFSHVIVEWMSDISTAVPKDRVQAVINAMDAIKAGTSVTYESRTYDYSGLVNVTPVAVFGGHAHIDHSFYTAGGIPVILTTCDSDIQEAGGLTRTRRTSSEQAFEAVAIDYTNHIISLTRVGAGQNREFTF